MTYGDDQRLRIHPITVQGKRDNPNRIASTSHCHHGVERLTSCNRQTSLAPSILQILSRVVTGFLPTYLMCRGQA